MEPETTPELFRTNLQQEENTNRIHKDGNVMDVRVVITGNS